MQLVLSNNRIIAHGENFLAMGGTVINTETGAKYDNATVTECEGNCPADIDSVGYEYHSGVFVPCAPYGKGNNNGYIMEVCNECATPRNSGVPIKNAKWETVASQVFSFDKITSNTTREDEVNFGFTVSGETLKEYSSYRLILKAGSSFEIRKPQESDTNTPYLYGYTGYDDTNTFLNISTFIPNGVFSYNGAEISSMTRVVPEDVPFLYGDITQYCSNATDKLVNVVKDNYYRLVIEYGHGWFVGEFEIELQARG